MDLNNVLRRREEWDEMNSQYDIPEFDSSAPGATKEYLCVPPSYQYPLEMGPLESQSQLQKPEHQESVPSTYMENASQPPIDNLDPTTAWQLSIQPPSSLPPAITTPNHEDMYQSSLDYCYPATGGVMMPPQYSLPPSASIADELPAFNSIPGGEF